jgi:tetratricopeptide (TPR) repeat protein
MRCTATLPGGDERVLFAIDEWDFDWQDDYRYREPVALPAGTLVSIEYVYDNSEANDNNPLRPLRRVRFGQESSDEMGTLTLSVTVADDDRAALDMALVDRELEKLPDAWNILLRKGRLERDRGNIDAAEQAVTKARRISPGAPDVWIESALCAEARGRLDEAGRCYEQALRLDDQNGFAHLQLGAIVGRAGDNEAALRHFEAAVRVLPSSPTAHNNLATANFALDRLPAAERHYRRAVELEPGYFNAWFNLGRVLMVVGRKDGARDALQRAAAIRPDVDAVQELLREIGR